MTKDALFIEGRRNGYSPDQCGRTMTVGELIEFLGDFDEDTEIFIRNDRGTLTAISRDTALRKTIMKMRTMKTRRNDR